MIRINSLKKDYTSKKGNTVSALKNLSTELPDRGLIFVMGKSGSGKSTFLNLLGGLDRPTDGEIIVDGKSSKNFTEKDFDAYRNEYVGFIFQEYNLIEQYSVGSNIAIALELHKKKAGREEIDGLLDELELTDEHGETLYNRKINELSGGQKQRVAIARALIKNPKLILADEPTGALDSETGNNIYKLLKKLSDERLIIVVTHDKESAEKFGDRIIELKDGQIQSDSGENKEQKKTESKEEKPFTPKLQGKLTFKRILTMGISKVVRHKVRLAFSVILAVISFTLFTFATVSATADTLTAELNAAYKAGANTVVLQGVLSEKTKHVNGDGNRSPSAIHESESSMTGDITEEQAKKLEKLTPLMPVFTLSECNFDDYGHLGRLRDDLSFAEKYNPYNYYGFSMLTELVELNPETGESDAGLTPDRRLTSECRLPQNFFEIAITDFIADMFIRFGYIDKYGDKQLYTINSPDDLIGKEICGLTICGVYETDNDRAWLKENYDFDNSSVCPPDANRFSDDMFIKQIDNYIYPWLKGQHAMKYGFVCNGFKNKRTGKDYKTYNKVLFRLSGDINKDKAILKELEYVEKFESRNDNINSTIYMTISHSVRIRTGMSGFVDKVTFVNDKAIVDIFIYLSIGLAFFSALLMMNFLTAEMSARKKEIGILRALGAGKADVGLICLTESLFIAVINFIVTLIATGIICLVINLNIYLPLFIIGVIPFFTLFALCFGISVLASIIPAIKIMRKKPFEIINNNIN